MTTLAPNPKTWDTSPDRGPQEPGDPVPHLRPSIHHYILVRRGLGELNGKTPRTQDYTLTAFCAHVGDRELRRVTRHHIQQWMCDLETAGICASTRYTRFAIVRTFFRWAVTERLIKQDPTLGIKGPRRTRTQPRALSEDAVGAVLAAIDERLAVCLLLACQEGLRRAEILHLTVGDVHGDGMLRVWGKGAKERWVPLSSETAGAIDTYLTAFPASPTAPLIRSYQQPGKGIHPDHLTRLVQQAMTVAGVKSRPFDGKSLHAGRHTCAVDMLDNDADIRDVQEMLGHAHASTTWDTYGNRHRAVARLRDAAAGRTYRKE